MNDTTLRDAAASVVARWDTPAWKEAEHTDVFINRLRAALESPPAQAEPATLLRSALNGMLTQFGMDEDELNKPTFDAARRAWNATSAALASPQPAHPARAGAMPDPAADASLYWGNNTVNGSQSSIDAVSEALQSHGAIGKLRGRLRELESKARRARSTLTNS